MNTEKTFSQPWFNNTTQEYKTIKNALEYFISNKKESLWEKNKEHWKKSFKSQLQLLKLYLDNNVEEKMMRSFMYRLAIGYWGIGVQNGIRSGVVSAATIGLDPSLTTDDHVFGVVEIGKTVHDAFVASRYDIDFMVNEWLYNNIWLWISIRVTRQEHNPSNIIKHGHTIEEKKCLLHYHNVSQLMAKTA
jgi:hypothetical protein